MSGTDGEPRWRPDEDVASALRDLDAGSGAAAAADAALAEAIGARGNRPHLMLVPAPGTGGAQHPFRPLIADIHVAAVQHAVLVTLDLEGWVTSGSAPLHDDADVAWAAATATLAALGELVPEGIDLELLGVEARVEAGGVPAAVLAAVRCTTADGHEDLLLGAVVIRAEASVAAVRATLDALNRRLGQLVRGG